MRALVTVLLLLVLLAPVWASGRTLNLVQWTDIHYGNEQWDPSAWHEALRLGSAAPRDAVLLTGDNADNKCSEEEFRRRTHAFLKQYGPKILAQGAPVLLSLGNNDFGRNYQTDPENMAPVMAAYRKYLGRAFYLDDLGNGTYPKAVGGMAWISLNSLVFSPENEYEHRGDQVERTFRWLGRELARVPAGRPVVLLVHIPPTWDLYSKSPAWEPQALRRLRDLLAERKGPVTVVGGHFHRNEVHALSLPGGRAVPVLEAGSLSLKYGQRANWRTYAWPLGADGVPSAFAYRLRYPGHPGWDRSYRVDSPFLARTWSALVDRLASDDRFYRQYMEDLWAHNPSWTKSLEPQEREAVLHEVFVDTSGAGSAGHPGPVGDACCR